MSVSVPSDFSERRGPVRRPFKLLHVLAGALLLAACSGNEAAKDGGGTMGWSDPGSGANSTAPTPGGPSLNWQTRLSGDTVVVEIRDANDYYRVDRVELTGPDGVTIAANEINRTTTRASGDSYGGYGGGPSVGFGVGSWSGSRGSRSGSASGVGLGFDFPLGGSSEPSPTPTGTITMATVRIPDLSHYRETADQWVVRVSFTDRNNEPQAAVIPAPKPAG
jgi:hypothetical protein